MWLRVFNAARGALHGFSISFNDQRRTAAHDAGRPADAAANVKQSRKRLVFSDRHPFRHPNQDSPGRRSTVMGRAAAGVSCRRLRLTGGTPSSFLGRPRRRRQGRADAGGALPHRRPGPRRRVGATWRLGTPRPLLSSAPLECRERGRSDTCRNSWNPLDRAFHSLPGCKVATSRRVWLARGSGAAR